MYGWCCHGGQDGSLKVDGLWQWDVPALQKRLGASSRVCASFLGAGPSSAVKYKPGLEIQGLGYRCVMVTEALF